MKIPLPGSTSAVGMMRSAIDEHSSTLGLPANQDSPNYPLLLGHSTFKSEIRYLGVEIDDAIEIAEKIHI